MQRFLSFTVLLFILVFCQTILLHADVINRHMHSFNKDGGLEDFFTITPDMLDTKHSYMDPINNNPKEVILHYQGFKPGKNYYCKIKNALGAKFIVHSEGITQNRTYDTLNFFFKHVKPEDKDTLSLDVVFGMFIFEPITVNIICSTNIDDASIVEFYDFDSDSDSDSESESESGSKSDTKLINPLVINSNPTIAQAIYLRKLLNDITDRFDALNAMNNARASHEDMSKKVVYLAYRKKDFEHWMKQNISKPNKIINALISQIRIKFDRITFDPDDKEDSNLHKYNEEIIRTIEKYKALEAALSDEFDSMKKIMPNSIVSKRTSNSFEHTIKDIKGISTFMESMYVTGDIDGRYGALNLSLNRALTQNLLYCSNATKNCIKNKFNFITPKAIPESPLLLQMCSECYPLNVNVEKHTKLYGYDIDCDDGMEMFSDYVNRSSHFNLMQSTNRLSIIINLIHVIGVDNLWRGNVNLINTYPAIHKIVNQISNGAALSELTIPVPQDGYSSLFMDSKHLNSSHFIKFSEQHMSMHNPKHNAYYKVDERADSVRKLKYLDPGSRIKLECLGKGYVPKDIERKEKAAEQEEKEYGKNNKKHKKPTNNINYEKKALKKQRREMRNARAKNSKSYSEKKAELDIMHRKQKKEREKKKAVANIKSKLVNKNVKLKKAAAADSKKLEIEIKDKKTKKKKR